MRIKNYVTHTYTFAIYSSLQCENKAILQEGPQWHHRVGASNSLKGVTAKVL